MLVISVEIIYLGEILRTGGQEIGDDEKNVSSVSDTIANASFVFHLLLTAALRWMLMSFPVSTWRD